MASGRSSLRMFLANAKSMLKGPETSQPRPLTFVVGNASADIDSICCALVYAYIRSSTPPYLLHIPLSNIPSSDLSLRPELNPVLAKADLQPCDLITLSDLPQAFHSEEQPSEVYCKFILVDHNVPTGLISKWKKSSFVGCIDHHEDEKYILGNASEPHVVEESGSCMSLIVSECRKAWENVSQDADDAKLAHIALAPVLIDTNSLKYESKTKGVDRMATEFLESILSGTDYDRETYFEQITKAKQDIGSLSLEDIFRKDYKMWEENGMKLGTGAVVKDIDFLIEKANGQDELIASLGKFAADQELAIFAVMTAFTKADAFQRELLIFCSDPKAAEVVGSFERSEKESLGLESWKGGILNVDSPIFVRCWTQRKVEHSRKQVGPMLRNAMRQ